MFSGCELSCVSSVCIFGNLCNIRLSCQCFLADFSIYFIVTNDCNPSYQISLATVFANYANSQLHHGYACLIYRHFIAFLFTLYLCRPIY